MEGAKSARQNTLPRKLAHHLHLQPAQLAIQIHLAGQVLQLVGGGGGGVAAGGGADVGVAAAVCG